MKLMSKNSDREINRIIHLMQTDKSVNAPDDAIRWSKNIFRTRAVEPEKSVVKRFLAVLKMDLSPNRAAFGERSASATQDRQMLFQAGANDIDLRIKQTEKGLSVRGQILGRGLTNCSIEIFNETASFETQTTGLSEFMFVKIPSGMYSLSLRDDEREIVIEDLMIQ